MHHRSQPVLFAVASAAILFTLAAGDAYAPEPLPRELEACTALPDPVAAVDPSQAALATYLSRRFLVA
jgi:hypothetical protein